MGHLAHIQTLTYLLNHLNSFLFRTPVLLIDEATECEHRMVMKDLCCDCGADLRKYVPSIKYHLCPEMQANKIHAVYE